MTGKNAELSRVLLPFWKGFGLCKINNIKASFYSATNVSGTRFYSNSSEREPDFVEEVPRAQTTIDVLRNWGCDDTHVATIFERNPSLRKAVPTKLESKLILLKKLGVTSSGLVKMICNRPRFINCRFNINFDERLSHLQSLFGSKDVVVKAIVRNPSLLVHKFHDEVEPVLALYEQMGLSRSDLVSMLLHRPTLIHRTNFCEEKLEFIRRTGITKESKMFKYVVTIIGVSRVDTIREKVANLEKFGISEDEVLQLFGRSPLLMTFSVDKIQRNMTFVVGMMKLPASKVIDRPVLLTTSLENILKPRALLAGRIQEMGLEPQIKGTLLFTSLRMTEQRFLNKFVRCHDKDVRQELLAYYKATKGIKRLAASSKTRPHTLGFPF